MRQAFLAPRGVAFRFGAFLGSSLQAACARTALPAPLYSHVLAGSRAFLSFRVLRIDSPRGVAFRFGAFLGSSLQAACARTALPAPLYSHVLAGSRAFLSFRVLRIDSPRGL